MNILIANKDDEKRIRELVVEMLQYVYQKEDVTSYLDGYFDRFFSNKEDRIYVAKDDIVVAFISVEVHHDELDYIYLDDFIVTKDYRNLGIGHSLMLEVFKYAKELGINSIVLHVEKTNAKAFNFYTNLGFSIFKDDNTRLLLEKKMEN